LAWLIGWNYRKELTIAHAAGAGTYYPIPLSIKYVPTSYPTFSAYSDAISPSVNQRHNFQPVHTTNIVVCNLTIDGSSRTYLAYDSDADGSQIRLYYADSLDGPFTQYSGNPILGPSNYHYRWPSVALVSGTLHMFLTDRTDGNCERWTSTDGITFTYQETVFTGGNQYKNPFIWLNPNDSNWYLYHHDNAGADENIKVRSAAAITGLAASSDTTVLTNVGAVLGGPSVLYKDGYYWLLAETQPSSWNVVAYRSTSPTSGFTACDNSPIITDDEACPVHLFSPDGSKAYLYTAFGSAQWWAVYRSSAFDTGLHTSGHAKADWGDLRFTASDGTTLLDYWIEEKVNSVSATAWVEVSDSLSTVDTTIYMYYGHADETDAGNGVNTFTFFDDFSVDISKWTVVKIGRASCRERV
jgi:hypothetical protein